MRCTYCCIHRTHEYDTHIVDPMISTDAGGLISPIVKYVSAPLLFVFFILASGHLHEPPKKSIKPETNYSFSASTKSTSRCVMSYHIMSSHLVSRHVTSCQVTSRPPNQLIFLQYQRITPPTNEKKNQKNIIKIRSGTGRSTTREKSRLSRSAPTGPCCSPEPSRRGPTAFWDRRRN